MLLLGDLLRAGEDWGRHDVQFSGRVHQWEKGPGEESTALLKWLLVQGISAGLRNEIRVRYDVRKSDILYADIS